MCRLNYISSWFHVLSFKIAKQVQMVSRFEIPNYWCQLSSSGQPWVALASNYQHRLWYIGCYWVTPSPTECKGISLNGSGSQALVITGHRDNLPGFSGGLVLAVAAVVAARGARGAWGGGVEVPAPEVAVHVAGRGHHHQAEYHTHGCVHPG